LKDAGRSVASAPCSRRDGSGLRPWPHWLHRLERLEEIAVLVSAHAEVNHNYQREHAWNLWFVATAADQDALTQVLAAIEGETGCIVLSLPLEQRVPHRPRL
jgi:hypothetical protein